MKKLTLKQLYGYSIMNWEQFQNRLDQDILERECSFCRDSDWKCWKCRINEEICNDVSPTIFHKISKTELNLEKEVNNIIYALREEYYKVK